MTRKFLKRRFPLAEWKANISNIETKQERRKKATGKREREKEREGLYSFIFHFPLFSPLAVKGGAQSRRMTD